jgi:hypothetical protein
MADRSPVRCPPHQCRCSFCAHESACSVGRSGRGAFPIDLDRRRACSLYGAARIRRTAPLVRSGLPEWSAFRRLLTSSGTVHGGRCCRAVAGCLHHGMVLSDEIAARVAVRVPLGRLRRTLALSSRKFSGPEAIRLGPNAHRTFPTDYISRADCRPRCTTILRFGWNVESKCAKWNLSRQEPSALLSTFPIALHVYAVSSILSRSRSRYRELVAALFSSSTENTGFPTSPNSLRNKILSAGL